MDEQQQDKMRERQQQIEKELANEIQRYSESTAPTAAPKPPRLKYAAFWERAVASLVDAGFFFFVGIGTQTLVAVLIIQYYASIGRPPSENVLTIALILSMWLVPFSVTMVYWRKYEATPGKRFLLLRIVDAETGKPVSIFRLMLRYFGYFPSSIVGGFGYFWSFYDKKHQTWHDKLGHTVVVSDNPIVFSVPGTFLRALFAILVAFSMGSMLLLATPIFYFVLDEQIPDVFGLRGDPPPPPSKPAEFDVKQLERNDIRPAPGIDLTLSRTYFPIEPGNRWTYDVRCLITTSTSKGPVKQSAKGKASLATRAESTGSGASVLMASLQFEDDTPSVFVPYDWGSSLRHTDAGLIESAIWDVGRSRYVGGRVDYSKPLLLLKSPAQSGETWTLGGRKFGGLEMILTSRIEANEDVEVPPRIFRQTLKVVSRSPVTGRIPWKNGWQDIKKGEYQRIEWYSPGIGLVKSEATTTLEVKPKSSATGTLREVGTWTLRDWTVNSAGKTANTPVEVAPGAALPPGSPTVETSPRGAAPVEASPAGEIK